MGEALREAEKSSLEGEVPVGALMADADGEILAKAHNLVVTLKDPTAHAEILALRSAAARCENYRLAGTTLVVTIEPCIMCMGAALNARISRLVFGAYDPKGGAAGSLYDFSQDSRLNHRFEVVSGIRGTECARLMREFFEARRDPR